MLSSFVSNLIVDLDSPNIIILHLGAEFIGRMNIIKLIGQFKQKLFNIHTICSSSLLIFSENFPVLAWSHNCSFFLVKISTRFNRSMHKFMLLVKGFSFRHINLAGFLPGFYLDNEVLLSPIGLDLFNLGLQSMLEEGLRLFRGSESVSDSAGGVV